VNDKKLTVVGPFHGPTGYDRHVRHFVRTLAAYGVAIHLIDLAKWSGIRLDPAHQDHWFESLDQPVDASTVLHFTMPHQVAVHSGKRNVNYTMFEATRIPQLFVDHHRMHDLVIVPTAACAQAWLKSGVPADKVRTCPLGVDAGRYRPGNKPLDLADKTGRSVADYRVRFLNVSEIGPRKNLLSLLRVWILSTRPGDDAILILKLGSNVPGWSVKLMFELSMMEKEIGRSRRECAPILFIDRIFSDEEMPGLFAAATHYWSMSHAEGWDQPMMEAGASGLKLIAPRHSAYETYLDDAVARMIPSREVPAVFPGGGEFNELFRGVDWWAPDEDRASEYVSAAVRGKDPGHPCASDRIRSEYTWEKATQRLMTLLFT
jgi:glycosyltransferase involved in cell wall biosynthesis